jgi:sugar/nucleoside kinase (ribokinase family)
MPTSGQILGISNAIVDVLAHVDDSFLDELGASKGSMTLIDETRARQIYDKMGPATEMSGGSVANTIAGIASLGGNAAYIGRVADDQLGAIFAHDMRSLGVDVRLPPAADGAPTARCYVFITPDGQRTMQTFLGACTELNADDLHARTIGNPAAILFEGYVLDTPDGQRTFDQTLKIAKAHGSDIALSLSDAECVARHRSTFLAAIEHHARLVVADDSEAISLFETDSFEATVNRAAELECVFALTRSENGSVVVSGQQKITQDAYPVAKVTDTTGAGDAYAAAFLFGWAAGKTLAECADLGSYAGAVVIQQIGARLEPSVFAGNPKFQQ